MDRPVIRTKHGPERAIQDRLIQFFRGREWLVKETHGNCFQRGFPDLYITHRKFGARWVEVKNAKSYSFTAAQLIEFPMFCANGAGIWILTDATEDEYKKLWMPPNWQIYLLLLNPNGYCK